MRSPIIQRTATSLAVVAALAGCGGGGNTSATTTAAVTTAAAAPTTTIPVGKDAYVAKMRALGKTIGDEFNRIYPIDTGRRGSSLEKATLVRLEHGQAVFGEVLATVRSMRPPAAVAADQRQLERGLAGVGAELGQVVEALRTGNLGATIVPSRLADISLVMSATADMEKRGYDVLGTHA